MPCHRLVYMTKYRCTCNMFYQADVITLNIYVIILYVAILCRYGYAVYMLFYHEPR